MVSSGVVGRRRKVDKSRKKKERKERGEDGMKVILLKVSSGSAQECCWDALGKQDGLQHGRQAGIQFGA